MIATLLLATLQTQSVQLGTVDIGGRQVAVTVPSVRGPFGPDTASVELDGFRFQVKEDLNLGVRYKSDGGWGEVADFYPAAATKSASAPEYRIKVFVFDNTCIVEKGHDGEWRERIGSLSPAMKDEVFSSLARLKALAETAADGGVRLTFDVVVDNDLLFRTARAGADTEYRQEPGEVVRIVGSERPTDRALLGPQFIYDEIAPRVNNDPFAAEDGKYRGPYSSVFVIHGMRTWDASTYLVDRTPVSSFSWYAFTDRDPGPALSIQLFYAWLQHLGVSAQAHNRDVGFRAALPTGDALPRAPHVYNTLVTPQLLAAGNHMRSPGYSDSSPIGEFGATDFSIDDARAMLFAKLPVGTPPNRGVYFSRMIGSVSGDHTFRAVHPAVLARFMEAHPGARPYGRMADPSGGWDRVLFGLMQPPENDCHGLGLEVGFFPSVRVVGPSATVGKVQLSPSVVGDFEAVFEPDPSVGPVVTIRENGASRRGYAVLAASDGAEGLFGIEPDTGITFQASCDLIDPYVLRLVTKSGKEYDVQLYGDSLAPAEASGTNPVIDARRRPVPFWSEFKVRLGEQMAGEEVAEVRLAPPRHARSFERPSDGSKTLKIGEITFGPVQSTEPPYRKAQSAEIQWLSALRAPLNDDSIQRMRDLLRSANQEIRLNAIGALTNVKCIELVPDLGRHTSSGFIGDAYLAFEALKHQKDDRAWSQIASAAIRGPFGMNHMFAASALIEKKEDTTLEVLGMSLLSSSWHARLAAIRTVNALDSENAAIVASATLGSTEPDPCVRFAIVSKPRPQSGLFARRLLFAAVNDESEWVRMRSYLALIDSETDEIRNEALKGVRDESVAIRLAILEAMTKRPQGHYRAALRSAVVDREPVVRAAVLRAFAVQPGDVVIAEVQNTLNDPSPLVQQALRELATAKGLQIPPMP